MFEPSDTQVRIGGQCGFCGYWHSDSKGMCPNIEEIEYYPNGLIKRFKLRPLFGGATKTTSDIKVSINGEGDWREVERKR